MEMKRIRAVFFVGDGGEAPVRKWLLSLSKADRKFIGTDICQVEFGWPLGLPVCRGLGDGLWEVRSHISDGRISRVLFGIVDGEMVLLHGFIKKTAKTPKQEHDLALKRLRMIR
ncbi:MAG: type II toxin-antitoxin system RelE/ParE family toxin [Candidatus Hydrogenedentes bacterium]|nr:type II toxin-antitoxin system RelE/ParE family toxin [Candidatus Hydrogenedentota bacterium]